MDPLTLSALIGGGSTLIGMGSDYLSNESKRRAANRAAATQNAAYDSSDKVGNAYYDDINKQLSGEAGTYLSDLSGWREGMSADVPQRGEFDDSKYNVQAYLDPSMKFQQQQMVNAQDASAAHGGMLNSGAQLKALQDRSAELAQTDYANASQRMMQDKEFGYKDFSDKFTAARLSASDKLDNLTALAGQSGAARSKLFDSQGKQTEMQQNSILNRAGVTANNQKAQGDFSANNYGNLSKGVQSLTGAASSYYGKGAK